MNYVSRTMEKTIEKFIGKYPVIMVTGPRQVGKTTLLNYLKFKSNKKINYVTLDDMLIRTQANEDPELFLRTHEAPLIIDEFQYAPNLLTYIKIIIDEARQNEIFNNKEEAGTMYYLTGSRVFETMKDVSESLAGRVGIFDLFAFSDRELYKMKEPIFNPQIDVIRKVEPTKRLSTNQIFERILKGSYPDVQAGREVSIENYYSNYIRTYIERDIRQLINIKNEIKFTKFISAVAARTGQEFNASKIATEIGIDGKTADDWISILKNTGIIYLLQSYTNNNATRAVRTQKVYFMDTGLACYLTGYTDNEVLEKSSYSGAIFETYKFLKDEFPNCNYEELILNYVNERCDNGKYKIAKVKGGYRTLKEINDAFNEAYEQSKRKLRFFERNDNNSVINKIINKEEWNDVLRKIEKMNEESNEKNIGLKRDEMLASLMCYFCPEYKNKIKSLKNEDLSAQKIFGITSFPEYSLEMDADEEEIDYI